MSRRLARGGGDADEKVDAVERSARGGGDADEKVDAVERSARGGGDADEKVGGVERFAWGGGDADEKVGAVERFARTRPRTGRRAHPPPDRPSSVGLGTASVPNPSLDLQRDDVRH